MLFLLRFIIAAFGLIITTLVLPDFELGGRYQILLAALLVALGVHFLRRYWGSRFLSRPKGFFNGMGALGGLLVTLLLFQSAIHLTLIGVIFFYLGISLVEIVLPDQMGTIHYPKNK